jgi:hypothetical protein
MPLIVSGSFTKASSKVCIILFEATPPLHYCGEDLEIVLVKVYKCGDGKCDRIHATLIIPGYFGSNFFWSVSKFGRDVNALDPRHYLSIIAQRDKTFGFICLECLSYRNTLLL